MIEASKSDLLRPAGLSDGETEDNAPVNIDAILQLILGTGSERFGMVAAVLRGERIIAQGAAGNLAAATPGNREAGPFAPARNPSGHQILVFQCRLHSRGGSAGTPHRSWVGRPDARTTVSATGHQHGWIRAAGHRW